VIAFGLYVCGSWLRARRRHYQGMRSLVSLARAVPLSAQSGDFADLLDRPPFCAPRPAAVRLSADIRYRLPSKWRLRRGKGAAAEADIRTAAERVLALRDGELCPAGLGLRWSHKKSPWTVSCLPRRAGAVVEISLDRRSYGMVYGIVLFVFLAVAWMILTGMLAGSRGPGLIAFPVVFVLGLAVVPLGRLLNGLVCLFYRLRISRVARRFVTALEQGDKGRR
jgi:hypothetical protein